MALVDRLQSRPIATFAEAATATAVGSVKARSDGETRSQPEAHKLVPPPAGANASWIRDGVLTLDLDNWVRGRGETIVDFCATLADGRAVPVWLARTSGNTLQGRRPAEKGTLEISVRAVLSNGKPLVLELRIDLATGAVEQLKARDRSRCVPLFGEQIRKFSFLGDTGAHAIATALDAVATRST